MSMRGEDNGHQVGRKRPTVLQYVKRRKEGPGLDGGIR